MGQYDKFTKPTSDRHHAQDTVIFPHFQVDVPMPSGTAVPAKAAGGPQAPSGSGGAQAPTAEASSPAPAKPKGRAG